jgi:hypothetical protein
LLIDFICFRWRGLILNQPERTEDGLQKVTVVTDDGSEGEVIFLGENPNEKTDFPSEEEQLEKIRAEELSKLKLIKTTKELQFGQYSGTTVDGKNHGDGMMTWANGQVRFRKIWRSARGTVHFAMPSFHALHTTPCTLRTKF